jgi:protoporphyrinogen oxidase
MNRLVIIGAGPAGLSAATEALRFGVSPVVLEADPSKLGGLSQTADYKGYRFDIGGHRFFSKNGDIERLWSDWLGQDMLQVPRCSRIYYGGKFYDYPLRASNALANLGILEALRCLASYAYSKIRPRTPVVSFEDWVSNQFGHRLYSIFFRTYTEKVWGMKCDQISADWAAQRIKGLSLWTAALSALGFKSGGQIKTLIECFRYPRLGPGQMWESAAQKVRDAEGQILMGRRTHKIHWDARGVYRIEAGHEHFETENVISTMPMRELLEALDPPPPDPVLRAAQALRYRDFLTVVLIVKDRDLFQDNWIYIHDPSVKVGRVQNYKNWSPEMVPDPGTTALGLEYFCFEGDGLWTASENELLELARQEICQLGLVQSLDILDGTVVRMKKAYPVYDHTYQANLEVLRKFLDTHLPNFQVAGRNGMHRYNNQDHAMLTGILATRNLLGQAGYNLWNVNGDAEYLEEDRGQGGRAVPQSIS